MKNKISKIFKNDFVKNVATLFSGSALSQVLIFLVTPLLSRLYSEELFGVYFIFLSTINILRRFTTLRFELAILLPKKQSWAINAFAVTVFFTLVTSVLILLPIIFAQKIIFQFQNIKNIASYLYLVPVTLFFSGIYEAISGWNNRLKQYKLISTGKVTLSTSTGLNQILFSQINLTNIGLILGAAIGQVLSTLVVIILSFKTLFFDLKYISIKKMKIILYKYKSIPIYNSLINIIFNISNELPTYLFTGFYSLKISGFYGMSNKLIGTPIDLLGRSIGQVFFQKASELKNQGGSIENLLKKTYISLLKISILPFALIAFLSPFMFVILGEQWRATGMYIFILIPYIFSNFLVQPVSSIYTIIDKQLQMLLYTIIMIFIKFIAIWFGFYFFKDALISLLFMSITGTIYRIFLIFWFIKISKTKSIS